MENICARKEEKIYTQNSDTTERRSLLEYHSTEHFHGRIALFSLSSLAGQSVDLMTGAGLGASWSSAGISFSQTAGRLLINCVYSPLYTPP